MRKFAASLATLASAVLPCLAGAQQGTSSQVSGNIGLVSEYRFRGIDQTFSKPAIQGGFDYTHPSGVYLGNWNSNVSSGAGYPNGNIEMDFYGGYKRAFEDFSADAGLIYYAYPGTSPKIDNKELYVGGGWKFVSAKFFYAVDDYFSTKAASGASTKGTRYLDLALNYDLGNGWGLMAHYGWLEFKNINDGSYDDWKLGLTKDLSGWLVGAALVGTNAKGNCGSSEPYCFAQTLPGPGGSSKDAGRNTVVLSIAKTF